MQKIRVKIKGFDSRVVDKTADLICKAAIDSGAKIKGPVFLPNNSWSMAVHRGPHIDAKSKEHLGFDIHSRYIEILEPNATTIETIANLQVPAGVDIIIK